MSEGMLFGDMPVVKSPKLLWLEKYGVKTRKADHIVQPGEEDDQGGDITQWKAWNYLSKAYGGATEDDALAAWARARGVRMWFEE